MRGHIRNEYQALQPTALDFENAARFMRSNTGHLVAPGVVLKAKKFPGVFSDLSLRFIMGNEGRIYAKKKGFILGEGSYGVVSLARDQWGRLYAIKDARPHKIDKKSKVDLDVEITREFHFSKLMSQAEENFVIFESDSDDESGSETLHPTSDVKSYKRSHTIVFKHLGVNLKSYLMSTQNISLKDKKLIAVQMIYCLFRVHQSGFVHRDVKLDNFVIDTPSKIVSLIDYGFAAYPSENVVFKGTPNNMSPRYLERWKENKHYALYAFDVFALMRSLYAGHMCFVINPSYKDGDLTQPQKYKSHVFALFSEIEVNSDSCLQKMLSYIDIYADEKFDVINYPTCFHLYITSLFVLNNINEHAYYFEKPLLSLFYNCLSNTDKNLNRELADKIKSPEFILTCSLIISSAKQGCWGKVLDLIKNKLPFVPLELYQSLLFEAVDYDDMALMLIKEIDNYQFSDIRNQTILDHLMKVSKEYLIDEVSKKIIDCSGNRKYRYFNVKNLDLYLSNLTRCSYSFLLVILKTIEAQTNPSDCQKELKLTSIFKLFESAILFGNSQAIDKIIEFFPIIQNKVNWHYHDILLEAVVKHNSLTAVSYLFSKNIIFSKTKIFDLIDQNYWDEIATYFKVLNSKNDLTSYFDKQEIHFEDIISKVPFDKNNAFYCFLISSLAFQSIESKQNKITPLMFAVKNDMWAFVKDTLESLEKIPSVDNYQFIFSSALDAKQFAVAKLILEMDSSLDVTCILESAIRKNDCDKIKLFKDHFDGQQNRKKYSEFLIDFIRDSQKKYRDEVESLSQNIKNLSFCMRLCESSNYTRLINTYNFLINWLKSAEYALGCLPLASITEIPGDVRALVDIYSQMKNSILLSENQDAKYIFKLTKEALLRIFPSEDALSIEIRKCEAIRHSCFRTDYA